MKFWRSIAESRSEDISGNPHTTGTIRILMVLSYNYNDETLMCVSIIGIKVTVDRLPARQIRWEKMLSDAP